MMRKLSISFLLAILTIFITSAQNIKLVGTTSTSGSKGGGTVIRYSSADSKLVSIKNFQSTPRGLKHGLAFGKDGYYYGVTTEGGNNDKGIVFKVSTDWTQYEILHHFNVGNGPSGKLVLNDAGDRLYGLTTNGGDNNSGTLFSLDTDGTDFSVLHNFSNSNGSNPTGELLLSGGVLYGVSKSGGTNGDGVIFKINTDGTSYLVIHNFNQSLTGAVPSAGLIEVSGVLYGTTYNGGANGSGTIFKIEKDGSMMSVIADLPSDAKNPSTSLTYTSDGYLFGTTDNGGSNDAGSFFKVQPNGANFEVFKIFSETNGADPSSAIIELNSTEILGTTLTGGANDAGVLYKVKKDGTGYTKLLEFDPSSGYASPNGNIYKTSLNTLVISLSQNSSSLIQNPYGGVLQVNLSGLISTEYYLPSTGGFDLQSGIIKAANGKYYGVTTRGGEYDLGVIFSMDTDGSNYQEIIELNTTTGGNALTGILEHSNGKMYVVTSESNDGLSRLLSFSNDGSGLTVEKVFSSSEGGEMTGDLFEDKDGFIIGVNRLGGANSVGTAWSFYPATSGFQLMFSFDSSLGSNPVGGVVQSSDGSLYVATKNGGQNGNGAIIKFASPAASSAANPQRVYSFSSSDGSSPTGLMIDTDVLYGTCESGGNIEQGSIFKYEISSGTFSTIKKFNGTDGKNPKGRLTLTQQGFLYGTTSAGGSNEYGVIFKLNTDGTSYNVESEFSDASGGVPGNIKLLEDDFDGAPISEQELSVTVEEDQDLVISLYDYFVDEDADANLIYTRVGGFDANLFDNLAILNGQMTINTRANAYGVGIVNIQVEDTKGQKNTFEFTVNISPVADTPFLSNSETTYGQVTTDGLIADRSSVDGDEIKYFKVTSINGGVLYLNDGTTQVTEGTFISSTEANKGFKFDPSAAGTGSVSIMASLADNDSGIGGNEVTAEINIMKADVSITAKNVTRAYGDENPAISRSESYVITGFVNGDDYTDIDAYPNLNYGATKFSNVGTYPILLSGGSDNNYNIKTTDGILTITKADLIVTATDKQKVYGEVNPAFTYSFEGFKVSDNESELNGSVSLLTTAGQYSDVGTYEIIISGFSSQNYNLIYQNGTLSITKRDLIISVNNAVKTYGQPNPSFLLSYNGFVGNDSGADIDEKPVASTTALQTSDAGVYPITLTGGNDNNYTFTLSGSAELTINKALLTASVLDASREYGEPDPAFSAVYSGFVLNQNSSVIDQLAEITSNADITSDVGEYVISGANASDNNYEFEYVEGKLTITKAPLSVSVQNASKEYGDANPAWVIDYQGFKNSDDRTVIDNAPQVTVEQAGSNGYIPGTYRLLVYGGSDNNYYFNQYQSGELTIVKATLNVSAPTITKVYGATVPSLALVYDGFKNNDSPSILDLKPSLSTSISTNSDAGVYDVTIVPGNDRRYNLVYTNGQVTVEKAELTFKADNKSRGYNQVNPTLTYTVSGFVLGQDKSVIDQLPQISTSATQSSNSGTYPITFTGGSDNNYTFKFINGTLTIAGQTASIQFADLVQDYDGTAKTVRVFTNPSGLSYDLKYSFKGDVVAEAVYPGTYTVSVTITEPNYQGFATAQLVINDVLSVEDDLFVNNVVWPNPTTGQLNIGLTDVSLDAIQVFGIDGREYSIGSYSVFNDKVMMDLSGLQKGTYLVRIISDDKTLDFKVVKQ
ncbi:choice-of-anchor tandem repeat GloVer-containing protein [Marinigracilibium pacificum]|uniref:T9SS type A sorting domain-containing protein n=1 Tax=Marinigracilibium pacificum TaxID=2729599 RepID=A0A848J702_9BACT|nr:choice-of-anchor tandem repeat GloVer-containing protein [Marinigracilibium pacificum]NMM50224.1 T9SS type A sorting domain-containing protein [Marinigracilibium pacificum]